jgi:hypothetical protein
LVQLWPLKKEEVEAFFNTIAQFTKARSIHSAFQKMFIPPLAIENDFFHSAFVNPCMM